MLLMDKFTPLAKLLYCRRHCWHWQISPLNQGEPLWWSEAARGSRTSRLFTTRGAHQSPITNCFLQQSTASNFKLASKTFQLVLLDCPLSAVDAQVEIFQISNFCEIHILRLPTISSTTSLGRRGSSARPPGS